MNFERIIMVDFAALRQNPSPGEATGGGTLACQWLVTRQVPDALAELVAARQILPTFGEIF
jgi:hypothetical protein